MSGNSHNKIIMGKLKIQPKKFFILLNNAFLLGAMTFGEEGSMTSRLTNLDDVGAVLDVFQKYSHKEVDTARTYKYVFHSSLHHTL